MLMQTVIKWAIGKGLPALMLLTLRDVRWKGPFYAAPVYHPLQDLECLPELTALRQHEAERGPCPEARLAMYLELPMHDGHGVVPTDLTPR
jgi:hypothetical protein